MTLLTFSLKVLWQPSGFTRLSSAEHKKVLCGHKIIVRWFFHKFSSFWAFETGKSYFYVFLIALLRTKLHLFQAICVSSPSENLKCSRISLSLFLSLLSSVFIMAETQSQKRRKIDRRLWWTGRVQCFPSIQCVPRRERERVGNFPDKINVFS